MRPKPLFCRRGEAGYALSWSSGVVVLLALLLLAQQPGAAQTDGGDEYIVEILVFRHNIQVDAHYRWPGEPQIDQAVELPQPHTAPQVGLSTPIFDHHQPSPLRPNVNRFGFETLASDSLQLVSAWSKLRQQPAYRPVLHLGWRQPASPFGQPQPVLIRGGEVIEKSDDALIALPLGRNHDVHEIDGTIALERGRFLHLRIDLALHRPVYDPTQAQPSPSLAVRNQRQVSRYHTYRLQERRQIRSGSVNYFDHRQFGVIALVSEAE